MNLQKIQQLIRYKKRVYNEAGNHYRKLNLCFVVPSICITTLSSIFAFLSTSEMMHENTKDVFLILVGIMTILSTMSQTMSSSFAYATKKDMFLQAADNYDKNLINVVFLNNETECDSDEDKTKLIETINKVQENIKQIEENCKYLPPNWIINKITESLNINEIQPLLMREQD